jgi:hypothetical protein
MAFVRQNPIRAQIGIVHQHHTAGSGRHAPAAAYPATTAASRSMTMEDEKYRKIAFELEQDENGYPPDRWETLWAYETESGIYCVDNIPFYVKGISSEDLVSAESDGEQLIFKNLVRPSSNSVVRLYVSDAADVQAARDSFKALGCESELSNLPKLVAVEIPGNVKFEPVGNLLAEGAEIGRWEYQEGVLRHQVTS